jgi:hypothetical protein
MGLAAIAVALFWGDGMLSRPTPTREGYLYQYFGYFDESQIDKLDYAYKGMFRGIFSVGRAEFKGPVKLNDVMVQAKIKAGLITEGTYDPTRMTEADVMWLRHEFETLAGGRLPSWFDFPFDRKMRKITEEDQGSLGDHGGPPHKNVWYIDDDKHIVYVRANCG